MSVAERLSFLVKFEGNQTKLAIKINSTAQSISQTIKQDGRLRSDTIEAIAKAYPELNMRWFITGYGKSGLDGDTPTIGEQEDDQEKELLKEELLSVYKQRITDLESLSKIHKHRVEELEREIKTHCEKLAERLELE